MTERANLVLVVANETLVGTELVDTLLGRAEQPRSASSSSRP